jgi:hypothetical protein
MIRSGVRTGISSSQALPGRKKCRMRAPGTLAATHCLLTITLLALLPLCAPLTVKAQAQAPAQTRAQTQADIGMATADRLQDPGWWPTKGTVPLDKFAPVASCRRCHDALTDQQHTTPMFQAARRASIEDLPQPPGVSFREGSPGASLAYLLKQTGEGMRMSVSDGNHEVSQPVEWAIGKGVGGQTYLLHNASGYTESRVSYYTALHALDITTGHGHAVPATMEQAFGKPLSPATAQACFGCHTTLSTTSNVFTPSQAVPGLSCQACHGPAAAHVQAMTTAPGLVDPVIFNPASLPPAASVDFCGSCHRTWVDVAMGMSPNVGLIAVRFQPYRLEKSRCWGIRGDPRITCVACHNPHLPLATDPVSYDKYCIACHAPGTPPIAANAPPAICKVGTSHCVSCHMPRFLVTSAHATFTDHDIRIVRPGEPFPQ